TSTRPPAASIFSRAPLLNRCARTVSFLVSSPLPSTFTTSKAPFRSPIDTRASASTVAPSSKRARSRTLTSPTFRAKRFTKPPLGRRRASGICPPSNAFLWKLPGWRAFWPFWPRPAVLPRPEPMPRPTRFFLRTAPGGGLSRDRMGISLSAIALLHRDEVDHLLDHPAEGGR